MARAKIQVVVGLDVRADEHFVPLVPVIRVDSPSRSPLSPSRLPPGILNILATRLLVRAVGEPKVKPRRLIGTSLSSGSESFHAGTEEQGRERIWADWKQLEVK